MITESTNTDFKETAEFYRTNIIRNNIKNLENDKAEYENKIKEIKKKINLITRMEFIFIYGNTLVNLLFGSLTLGEVLPSSTISIIVIEGLLILLTFFLTCAKFLIYRYNKKFIKFKKMNALVSLYLNMLVVLFSNMINDKGFSNKDFENVITEINKYNVKKENILFTLDEDDINIMENTDNKFKILDRRGSRL